jgi:hypothetical protein
VRGGGAVLARPDSSCVLVRLTVRPPG